MGRNRVERFPVCIWFSLLWHNRGDISLKATPGGANSRFSRFSKIVTGASPAGNVVIRYVLYCCSCYNV